MRSQRFKTLYVFTVSAQTWNGWESEAVWTQGRNYHLKETGIVVGKLELVWLMPYLTPKGKEKYLPLLYRCFLMINFKFGEEMRSVISISWERDTEKKSESPTLIEPIWPTVHRSDALTTELRWTCGELGHIQGLCLTCVLRTAWISDLDTYEHIVHCIHNPKRYLRV